jgi:carboxymethylenebutenolidase
MVTAAPADATLSPALQAAGVRYEAFTCAGVNRAFNNDTSAARHDKAAADLAWGRTLAWLK